MSSIPSWVKPYIGIPFKKKEKGLDCCDCLGLAQIIYEHELGIILPDYVHTDPDEIDLTSILVNKKKDDWIRLDRPEEYSLIILNIKNYPIHFGIALNSEHMIHTMKGHSSVIDKYTGIKWKSRIEGFYKWPCT